MEIEGQDFFLKRNRSLIISSTLPTFTAIDNYPRIYSVREVVHDR